MTLHPLLIEVLQLALLVGLAPALAGWIKIVKCRLQGRNSPGLLQPYRDLRRLFGKDVVLADNASWIFRFTPYLIFGVTVLIGGIIPLLSIDLPLAATADVIALVMLLAIIRFFTALAGMDIGTAFGGMGASREMMISALAEPAMLMATFTVSLASSSTSLTRMVTVMTHGEFIIRPSLAFALAAFILVALAETGRIPVDNPATHLELTMIHEAMILEYSGRHLALMEWAASLKLYAYSCLGLALFLPWGIASGTSVLGLAIAIPILVVKLAVGGFFLAGIESINAKVRIFRAPEFLGTAFLLAVLGLLVRLLLETRV